MNRQSGLIKLILLIVVAILIISYFKINLRQVAESDTGRANFSFLMEMINRGWQDLLGLWHQYVNPYLPQFLTKIPSFSQIGQ